MATMQPTRIREVPGPTDQPVGEPSPETVNLMAMALTALSEGARQTIRQFVFPLIALISGLGLAWKIIPAATELQLWGLAGYGVFALGIVWLTRK